MPEDTYRCAQASRDRAEVLTGSALPTKEWLLVEYPGAWSFNAWPGLCTDEKVRDTVAQWISEATGRVQLIRQTGSRDTRTEPPFRWFYVGSHGSWRGTWTSLSDLASALTDITAGRSPEHALAGLPEPLILVCAHSKHDVCCAVRGRKVAAEAATRWGTNVWESSHLGGDRFAANVLLLPQAVMLGHVDDGDALTIIADALNGCPEERYFRGIAGLDPVAQAAFTFARRAWPTTALTDMTITHQHLSEHNWSVRVETKNAAQDIVVQDGHTEAQLNTCAAAKAVPVRLLTCVSARENSQS